jgi:hypothetical protein
VLPFFALPWKKALKSNPFPRRVDKSYVPKEIPTKSKIVISSEIGITCDESGCFIATHSAIKFDVKHRTKEYGK